MRKLIYATAALFIMVCPAAATMLDYIVAVENFDGDIPSTLVRTDAYLLQVPDIAAYDAFIYSGNLPGNNFAIGIVEPMPMGQTYTLLPPDSPASLYNIDPADLVPIQLDAPWLGPGNPPSPLGGLPEPASLTLAAAALCAFAGYAARNRRRRMLRA